MTTHRDMSITMHSTHWIGPAMRAVLTALEDVGAMTELELVEESRCTRRSVRTSLARLLVRGMVTYRPSDGRWLHGYEPMPAPVRLRGRAPKTQHEKAVHAYVQANQGARVREITAAIHGERGSIREVVLRLQRLGWVVIVERRVYPVNM